MSKSPLSLPLYVAEVAGYFQDEGLKVRFTECVGGHRCLKLMLDGQVDVATAGDTPVMFNSFQRTDFAVIGTIASTMDDLKLYVRKEAGITRPRDLARKRVGVVIGTASHYFLDSLLMIHGVDPRDIQPVPMQPEAMQEALQTKRVDAVSVWSPTATASPARSRPRSPRCPTRGAYSAVFNLVVHRRLVGARDADLAKLLTAVDRAETLIRDDPARAKLILRQRLADRRRLRALGVASASRSACRSTSRCSRRSRARPAGPCAKATSRDARRRTSRRSCTARR